jgi:glycosyltransferase involved in cell wall biosynthesis
MKILYVSPYPPAPDGIGDYTWMLANAVQEAGNDIRVVVPYAVPHMPAEVIGTVTSRQGYAGLRQAVARWQPDIVHVQFAIAAFGTRTLALMRWLDALRAAINVPVVITLHELTRESALLRIAGRAVHRGIARRCDHYIVHSDVVRQALVAEIGVPEGKVSVIPHPSAQPRAASSASAELRARFGLGDARVLLAFGFIHVDKGLDDLIRALSIVRATWAHRLDDVRVVVAGEVRPRHGLFRALEARDRLYRARLVRLIRHSALDRLVIMTGYVPDGEVAPWFDLAEAVVLPYRRAEQSGVEGLARAFNVPVLASAVGGLAEQTTGSRWTFPPGAPDRVADTLADFLASTPAGQPRRPPDSQGADLGPVMAMTLELYGAVTAGRAARASHVA